MTETRLNAALPTLDVEIVHRQLPDQSAELMTISLKATPSFSAATGLLPPLMSAQLASLPAAQPMVLWARCVEAMWQPWLQMVGMPLRLMSDLGNTRQLPRQP